MNVHALSERPPHNTLIDYSERRKEDFGFIAPSAFFVFGAAYYRIPYPGGDIQADRGVCADVVVKAYRKVGVDLQKEVHKDMRAIFFEIPQDQGTYIAPPQY